jgi:DNA-directed RNA polymerase specialized sigma24 family protein
VGQARGLRGALSPAAPCGPPLRGLRSPVVTFSGKHGAASLSFPSSYCKQVAKRLARHVLFREAMRRNQYAEAFQNGFPATKRFLLSRGAALEEAEEIAQAAWARGWEYRDQLRDPGLVGFWVNSIARNLFRAKFRMKTTVPIDGVDAPYTMNLDEIDLRRLLDRCSPRDRDLLERSLEGYSAEEIAKNEGITSTGIRVRMLRIRQSLRDRLALQAA